MTTQTQLNPDYIPTNNPVGSTNNDNINQSKCNSSLKTNMSGASNVNSNSQHFATNSDSSQFSKPDDPPPLTTIINGLKNKTPQGVDPQTWNNFLEKAQSTLNTSGKKDSQMTAVTNVLQFLSDGDIQLKIPKGILIKADGTVEIDESIAKRLTIGDYKWKNKKDKDNYLNKVKSLLQVFQNLNNAKHNDAITNILDALKLESNQVNAGKEPIGYQLINTLTQLIQNIATELDNLEKSTDRLTNEDIQSSLEQIASLFQEAFQELNSAQSTDKDLPNNYTNLQEQTEQAITVWIRFKYFFASILTLIRSAVSQINSAFTQMTSKNQELHQKQALAAIALYNFTPENIARITSQQAKELFNTLDPEEQNKAIQNEKQQIKPEITHQKEEIEKEIQNKKTQIEENKTQITKLNKEIETLPEVKQANEAKQAIEQISNNTSLIKRDEIMNELIQNTDIFNLHHNETMRKLFNINTHTFDKITAPKNYNIKYQSENTCQYLTVNYDNTEIPLFKVQPLINDTTRTGLSLVIDISNNPKQTANAFIKQFCSKSIQDKIQNTLNIQTQLKTAKRENKNQLKLQYILNLFELLVPQ